MTRSSPSARNVVFQDKRHLCFLNIATESQEIKGLGYSRQIKNHLLSATISKRIGKNFSPLLSPTWNKNGHQYRCTRYEWRHSLIVRKSAIDDGDVGKKWWSNVCRLCRRTLTMLLSMKKWNDWQGRVDLRRHSRILKSNGHLKSFVPPAAPTAAQAQMKSQWSVCVGVICTHDYSWCTFVVCFILHCHLSSFYIANIFYVDIF